jgi:hypothetical protein
LDWGSPQGENRKPRIPDFHNWNQPYSSPYIQREREREKDEDREGDEYTYIAIPNVSHTLFTLNLRKPGGEGGAEREKQRDKPTEE